MNLIKSLRITNRILIAEGKEHEVVNLLLRHSDFLIAQLCVSGRYHDGGAYIHQLVVYPKSMFTIENLKQFLAELTPLVDYYKGIHVFTIAEFFIKAVLKSSTTTLDSIRTTEIVAYIDHESYSVKLRTINIPNEKIIPLAPQQQVRITQGEYKGIVEGMMSMTT